MAICFSYNLRVHRSSIKKEFFDLKMVLDYRVSPPARLFVSDRGRPSIVDPTKRRVSIIIENDVISLPEEAEILIPSWRRWPIAILFALYSGEISK